MATVQKIKNLPYERQGLIEFDGEPEDLGEWLDAYDDEVSIVETGLLGWGPYTLVAKLEEEYGAAYYLLPIEARLVLPTW